MVAFALLKAALQSGVTIMSSDGQFILVLSLWHPSIMGVIALSANQT